MIKQSMYDNNGYILAIKPSIENLESLYDTGCWGSSLTYQGYNYIKLLEGEVIDNSWECSHGGMLWFSSMCWKHKDHLLSDEDLVLGYKHEIGLGYKRS